jgi:protocatechuate 3,4-dioxygenase beta subunit
MTARVTPLLLFAIVLSAQDKPPEKCVLSGTVVNSVTGEPLNKVELALEEVDRTNRLPAVTTTDAEGRFSMVDLDPGAYHLTGKRPGFLETSYGARRAEGEGAVLRLEAGQPIADLKLKLIPYGVIAGTIRDTDGEPLAGAYVSVSRLSYEFGKPRLESYTGAETDDLGQYRIRDLAPGKYYVGARPNAEPGAKVDHSAGKAPRESPVSTVYPGSADASLAAPVEIATGARVTGIDITMARARTFTVKGRVVTSGGSGAPNVAVTLRKSGNPLDIDLNLHSTTRNANGDFELRGVQSGSYLLLATRNQTEVAARPLEVAGDAEGVTIVLENGSQLKGKIVVEGEKALPGRFSVFLTTDGRRGYVMAPQSGQVTQGNVAPGRYEVRLMGIPAGLYLKSIRSGEADALSEGLVVAPGAAVDFEIALAADGGKVEGTALDKSGQPTSGATVLLAPELRLRSRGDLYKTATTDQFGKFEFASIAPGDYKVFAWEDVEPGIWNDPDFLKTYEKNAEPVTVQPKGHEVVKLAM